MHCESIKDGAATIMGGFMHADEIGKYRELAGAVANGNFNQADIISLAKDLCRRIGKRDKE